MEEDKNTAPASGNDVATEDSSKTNPPSTLHSLCVIVGSLETAVKLKETRITSGRVLRLTAALRQQLNGEVLQAFITSCLTDDVEAKAFLLGHAQQVSNTHFAYACTHHLTRM